ncbi:uncharacterized protein N7477_002951 [Penicillium maclennaniae]|uniref:uncharacterized protein n=1 Tax=Penicillium maclennaniae TaxID=1343394 RepID=UPI0025413314|nr:uncharacterized protein N7477_002951 [Penicillium maclennaniae]KAJ5677318.1 hypothetical protein N7477_002951 [Penicillium maclennaniae]
MENFYGMTEGVFILHRTHCRPGHRGAERYGHDWKAYLRGSGDQAFMGNDKQLYIVGRHKDMIVRGGKNLSPSRIEQVLNQEPQFLALEPQVVAGEDEIAGEVPIVVTRVTTSHEMENMMHESIRENLGVHYTPRAWISLSSLGLDDFPRSASGKIQKAKLRSLVANSMQLQAPEHKSNLSNVIVIIWSRLLGLQASHLDTSAPIAQAADSILMLSARAKIRSETGLSVSLTEWLAIPTIADQIKALEGIAAHGNIKEPDSSREGLRTGPPETEDMVHLGQEEGAFCATKETVEKIIGEQGFTWGEVENIFPCTDFVHILCRSQVINTWNIRTTILSQNASVQEMRTALEKTLLMHPMMLSYVVMDDKSLSKELGLYVTLRHSSKVLEKCILDIESVDTLQELRTIAMDYPFKDHAKLPGPLFRCLIIFVRETSSAAVITNSEFSSRTIPSLF